MSLAYAKEHSIEKTKNPTSNVKQNAIKRSTNIRSTFQVPVVQLETICPCDGGCPSCLDVFQTKPIVSQSSDEYEQDANKVTGQLTNVPELIESNSILAKIRISQPVDEFEREANQITEQIMNVSNNRRVGGEKNIERNSSTMPKNAPSSNSHNFDSLFDLDIGHPMEPSLRVFFESQFNYDFGNVVFHRGEESSKITNVLGAKAFSVGRHIIFGSGEYNPTTLAGNKLIAHELAHVVQTDQCENYLGRQSLTKSAYVTFNPIFDLETILGPIPEKQTISIEEKQMLELYRYLKQVRRLAPEQETQVKSLLEAYFPEFGDYIWEASKKPFAGYTGGTGRHRSTTPRMKKAQKLGLKRVHKWSRKKEYSGSDILFFQGHHWGKGMFGPDPWYPPARAPRGSVGLKELRSGRKRAKFENVMLILVSSCNVLNKSNLPTFRKTFPNAVILGWFWESPYYQKNMMSIFLDKLPQDLMLEDPKDMLKILKLWESFVENIEKENVVFKTKEKKVLPYGRRGLGYATPEGVVKFIVRDKRGNWVWKTQNR